MGLRRNNPPANLQYISNIKKESHLKTVYFRDPTKENIKAAAKIITLQRANTARGMKDKNGNMGCNDFRNIHDVMTEWPFTKDPDKQPFTEGTDKMEKQDFQKGLTMLYEKFGWDSELG